MKSLKSGREGKDLFSTLALKSGGAFVLPALPLVPPLVTGLPVLGCCTAA